MFFHTADNPFGNPRNVYAQMKAQPAWFILERFYGVAHREVTARFPRFGEIHIVKPEQVPAEGTNYLFMDPCGGGRNFALAYVRFCEDGSFYFYREWPSQTEEIPGYGVLGPWAENGNGKPGELDGRRGPGQRGIGLSLADYKKEIARMEGWPEYARWLAGGYADDNRTEYDIVAQWNENGEGDETRQRVLTQRREGGTEAAKAERPRENIFERYIDSRFGNAEHAVGDEVTTLIREFADLGLTFQPTSAEKRRSIDEGITLVNAALAWDENKKVEFTNRPRMYVSENCQNIIWALRNWTGADGQKGACKDFVDLVRYALLKRCTWVGEERWETTGGGHY